MYHDSNNYSNYLSFQQFSLDVAHAVKFYNNSYSEQPLLVFRINYIRTIAMIIVNKYQQVIVKVSLAVSQLLLQNNSNLGFFRTW